MKRLFLAFSLFFVTPVSAAEITSKITDSVQLGVQGAAVQSTRIGASYSVSGTNIQSSAFGGVAGAGTYSINTAGQAFTFSESFKLPQDRLLHQIFMVIVLLRSVEKKALSLVHYQVQVFLLLLLVVLEPQQPHKEQLS